MLQQKLKEMALGLTDSILAAAMSVPLQELGAVTASSLPQRAFIERGVGVRLQLDVNDTLSDTLSTSMDGGEPTLSRVPSAAEIARAEKKAHRKSKASRPAAAPTSVAVAAKKATVKTKTTNAKTTKVSAAAATKGVSQAALILKHLPKAPKFLRADKLAPKTGVSWGRMAEAIQDLQARGIVVTKAIGNHRGYATAK